jgi:hypothetical protein
MTTTRRVLNLDLTSALTNTLTLAAIPPISGDNIVDLSIRNADVAADAGIFLSKLEKPLGSALDIGQYVLELSGNLANVSVNGGVDASETQPGFVNITAQTFGGSKTFKDAIKIDEQQSAGSYNLVVNVPIKPFLVVPTQNIVGTDVGGGYYKYSVAQATGLTNGYNGIAFVANGITAQDTPANNTSFYAELTFIGRAVTQRVSGGDMIYTSESNTTKLLITCTGISVVNTVLGEQHPVVANRVKVTTHTVNDTFIILVNGIKFSRLLIDFYGANAMWEINSIDVTQTTTATDIHTNGLATYGLTAPSV